MELCDIFEGYFCLVGVDFVLVDRYIVVFYDILQVVFVILGDSRDDYVLLFIEDVVYIVENFLKGDLQSFLEKLYFQFLNEFFCYSMGGLLSQIFFERLADGCGY